MFLVLMAGIRMAISFFGIGIGIGISIISYFSLFSRFFCSWRGAREGGVRGFRLVGGR